MNKQEQQRAQGRGEGNVLDGKHDIQGMQPRGKSAVERAREDKSKPKKDCANVLDGPACIDGVDEKAADRG
jgi:hypothetical protein